MNGVAIATPTATATSGYQTGGTGTIFRAEVPNTAPAGFTGGTVDLYQPVTITQNGTQLTVDDPVQYVPPPTETLTYDADGNLKTDGRWTYTWDAADRLIKMESIAFVQNASPPLVAVNVPAKVIEFAYDGLSRRIRKKVTEGVSTIAVWEAYVYDGWNMLLSVKLNPAAGATQGRPQSAIASNVWAPDLGSQPFAREDWQAAGGVRGLVLANYFTGANGGGIHVPGMDPMGNVTSVTRLGMSYSAGESPGPYFRSEFVYDYDAFGKETRSSTLVAGLNPDSFPFHFSTKFTDPESGFNYYGYRFYDSANGRWINRDPIEEVGGENLYGMVGNDPLNYYDLEGLTRGGGGSRRSPVGNAQAMEQATRGQSALRKSIQDAITRLQNGKHCCSPSDQAKAIQDMNAIIGPTVHRPYTNPGEIMARTQQMRAAFDAALRRLQAAECTAMIRPKGVPDTWTSKPSDSGGGTVWSNPLNPNQTVRVMPGNPNSPYPNSQQPYVRQTNSAGQPLNPNGIPTPNNDPSSHIPVQNYNFMPNK